MNRRLGVAVAVSALVLAIAPVIGQLRGAVQAAFPDYYRALVVTVVLAMVAGAILFAAVRIRTRRRLRYGAIGLAVVLGTVYATAMATGNASVDAIERFHFVEYGILTLLFHRAFADAGTRSSLLLPALAVFIVGTLDEGIQWFVPARVGEWRDVLLNSVAIVCGLLFSLGVTWPEGPRSTTIAAAGAERRRVMLAGALAAIVFGLFFYTIHIGHEVRDPDIGTFRSRFTAEELREHAADRNRRWQIQPPLVLRRYSREDQYLAEALWHIQRRNEMDGPGGIWANWKENLILEKYFAPVLDRPTYATPGGARWPAEQRANAEAAAAGMASRPFVSDAEPLPIYTWFDAGGR